MILYHPSQAMSSHSHFTGGLSVLLVTTSHYFYLRNRCLDRYPTALQCPNHSTKCRHPSSGSLPRPSHSNETSNHVIWADVTRMTIPLWGLITTFTLRTSGYYNKNAMVWSVTPTDQGTWAFFGANNYSQTISNFPIITPILATLHCHKWFLE